MEVRASVKNIRVSPRKARLVVDAVRGKHKESDKLIVRGRRRGKEKR